MKKKKVFITGITGCVGHYVYKLLASDEKYHLYLLVRNLSKIQFKYQNNPNITIINSSLENISEHKDLISDMDYIIHIAAYWGGQKAFEINQTKTIELFNLVNQKKCKKIIYFSTASIIGPDNQTLEEAELLGTGYIVSKYRCFKDLPKLNSFEKIITLFPTMVLGGEDDQPYSHISGGLKNIEKHLGIIRFLSMKSSFHFIHSSDIALITKYLLENKTEKKEYVLGNNKTTFNDVINVLAKRKGYKNNFKIDITKIITFFVLRFMKNKISSWDIFCIRKRNFLHKKTVNVDTFGINSNRNKLSNCI
jgi:nucleoside-diphosphate-sugar epimerase